MFDWMKGWFEAPKVGDGAHVSPETAQQVAQLVAAGREEIEGLNFKSAIEAHLKWKERLRAVIDGVSDEKLDPSVVARDDLCVLGKWLHGVGEQKFGGSGRFKSVCAEHAQFHRCAAQVLQQAIAHRHDDAIHSMEAGPYRDASVRVTGELAGLFAEIGTL